MLEVFFSFVKNNIIIKTFFLQLTFIIIPNLCFSANFYFQQKEVDSIKYFIRESKKNGDLETKKKILDKAFNYFIDKKLKTTIDLSSIAYEYHKLNDSSSFFKVNKKAISIAKKNNDYYTLGDSHWNYATHYLSTHEYNKAFFHFNKGYNSFKKGNYQFESAKMLFGMSFIKGRYRDYIGSEILIFDAIKIFKKLNSNKDLYDCYNQLGHIQRDIKEYDRAITYYKKSLFFFKKIKKKKKYYAIFNNIGNTYREKKNYKEAIKNYNKELKNSLQRVQYAKVIDNRAYCKLVMKDTTGIKQDFFKALKIRDSIIDKPGVLMSKIRISDYYAYSNDTLKAIQYAKEANLLAKELKNGRDYLTTLKQLANLQPQNAKQYLDRHIEYNDSLITVERKAQNKFTRIEFETDEHIEEKERLGQQLIWIIGGSISIILISTLLYFLRVQKVRNEKLQLEADQQKANEEVYVLTLQQQAKLEEERVKERNRISAELHDGILGKLFGTRVNLGFLGMQMNTDTQEKQQAYLDELQLIEKEIREVSHKLSDNFNDANINFTSIITQLLEDKGTIGGFDTHFKNDKSITWKEISEVTKANVYRIIQEALQNIIKHAKAKNVTLAFSIENEKLEIQIADDGVGFDTKKSRKGIGIKNINSRIAKLQGNVSFISALNKGTTLQIKIPIT
ncbi:sensor histidine kinase [uncultured Tenacibaculum sp.]|uniref:tetratricopeptide repeat-containing sensor histidine kinase n=1 Tax=uncultured Tenacibaculum sp. TaxID=174713 RepID=UPI00261FC06F|nr:sensor histidine kinase [uncultured Tenacibaculum sp.]